MKLICFSHVEGLNDISPPEVSSMDTRKTPVLAGRSLAKGVLTPALPELSCCVGVGFEARLRSM